MKKMLFLVAAALFCATAASAQARYQGEVSLGGALGVGENGLNKLAVETVHGVRINPYLFCGAGIGLQDYVDLYDGDTGVSIPVFANVKGYLLDNDITPYLSFDIGYGFVAGNAFSGMDGSCYVSPTIGCQVKVKDHFGLNFGIGYQVQGFSIDFLDQCAWTHAFVFKIGFNF